MFVSYAQNFEDVMLRRVFKEVGAGFYIDVGAHHHKVDSVTRGLYDDGWHGINFEPVPYFHNLLQKKRPRDINLACIAGESPGEAVFYQMGRTGLSTTRPDFASRAAARGFTERQHIIPVRTLDQICAEQAVTHVDFLKIDVEGAEFEVLKGMGFEKVRPVVLVIEATEPMTQVFNHHVWEPYVIERGYRYVYGDGLNRFYLASERMDLEARFEHPPNVFDRFVKYVPPEVYLFRLAEAAASRPLKGPVGTVLKKCFPKLSRN